MNSYQLARIVDYLAIDGDLSSFRLVQIANMAKEYHLRSIMALPYGTNVLKNILKDSDTKINILIAYPYGQTFIQEKIFEAKLAIENGADEITYFASLNAIKDRKYTYLEEEAARMVGLTRRYNKKLNLAIDLDLLTMDELAKLARIAKKYQFDSIIILNDDAISEELIILRTLLNKEVKVEVVSDGDFRKILECVKAGVGRFALVNASEMLNEFKLKYER